MGTKGTIPYYQNLGGLVTRKSDTLVTGNEAQIARNVTYDEWGGVRQRDGFARELNVSEKVRLVTQHKERTSGNKTRLIVRGTRISKISGPSETVLASDLTASGDLCAAAQLFDDLIICTGNDKPRVYNDDGLAVVDTGTFKPAWCVPFNNFMIYGGDKDNPYRLVFSALGDAKSVVSNQNFVEILDQKSELTGGFVLFNSFYATSIDGITKIDGSDFQVGSPAFDLRVRNVWRGTGSVNFHSITVAHDQAFFLGKYGIYSFDGRTVTDVSDKINTEFKKNINFTKVRDTVSVHEERDNIVIISVPSANNTRPDTHYVFHYEEQLRSWAVWDGFEVSCWAKIDEAGDYPFLWHGNESGDIHRHGGQADDTVGGVAVPVHFRYRTGWETGGRPEGRFIMKHFMPIIQGTGGDTMDVTLFTNYSVGPNTGFPRTVTIPNLGPLWGSAVWGSFAWGGPEAQYIPTIGIEASVARNYSLLYEHRSLGKRFLLTGWTTTVITKGLTGTT